MLKTITKTIEKQAAKNPPSDWWHNLSENYKITIPFAEKYANDLCWYRIIKNPMSKEFLTKFFDRFNIDYAYLIKTQKHLPLKDIFAKHDKTYEYITLSNKPEPEAFDNINLDEIAKIHPFIPKSSIWKHAPESFIEKYIHLLMPATHSFNKYIGQRKLSQNFIETIAKKLKGNYKRWFLQDMAESQSLSPDFIQKYYNEPTLTHILHYQSMPDNMLEIFIVNKPESKLQFLIQHNAIPENLLRKYKNHLNAFDVSKFQKLSLKFIEEFKSWLPMDRVYKYQKLTDHFIIKNYHPAHFNDIAEFHKFSLENIQKYNIAINKDNWLYVDDIQKLNVAKLNGYAVKNNYVYAYKSAAINGRSVYSGQYLYEVGKIYTSTCDCRYWADNSFGLSAWTKERAIDYHDGKLFLVKIHVKNLGCFTNEGKIRARKIKIVKEETNNA